MTNEITNDEIQQLKALALVATPQEYDTAERVDEGGHRDCPTCGGDGIIEHVKGYCNYDGAAIGVDFYGIGPEHQNAEAYYRAANPSAILSLIEQVESLAAPSVASAAKGDDLPACAMIYSGVRYWSEDQMLAAVLAERAACEEACMRASPDRAAVKAIGESAHYAACRDAIRARN